MRATQGDCANEPDMGSKLADRNAEIQLLREANIHLARRVQALDRLADAAINWATVYLGASAETYLADPAPAVLVALALQEQARRAGGA